MEGLVGAQREDGLKDGRSILLFCRWVLQASLLSVGGVKGLGVGAGSTPEAVFTPTPGACAGARLGSASSCVGSKGARPLKAVPPAPRSPCRRSRAARALFLAEQPHGGRSVRSHGDA